MRLPDQSLRRFVRVGSGASLTLADQLVSSASNFAVGVLVARAGGANALGAFGIAFLVWIAAVGVNRALVTDPMTVLADPDAEADERLAQMRRGMTATLSLGLGWAAVLAAAGSAGLVAGLNGTPLLALAPWMPCLLLQDYWRATAFRLHQAGRALANDVVFALAQGSATVALFVTHVDSVAAFVAAWGIGGTAGALLGLRIFGTSIAFRGGIAHLRALWSQSRWFMAEFGTAFTSDQGYLLLLPALLSTADFGIYRAGASLIGPVIVIFMAGSNTALPSCTRHLRGGGIAGLRRYTRGLNAVVIGLATIYCALVATLAGPLLVLIYGPAFAAGATITRLVALQYVIFALGLGSGVALKAAGNIRQVWLARLLGAIASVSGLIVLTLSIGLTGAAIAGLGAALVYSLGLLIGYHRLCTRQPATPTTRQASPRTALSSHPHGRAAPTLDEPLNRCEAPNVTGDTKHKVVRP